MQIVEHIFEALGGVRAVAAEMRDPYQTVHSWKAKGAIPRWRRQPLLEMARRRGKTLSPDALLYLAEAE